MAANSGIYDNGPISPVAQIKQNLSVWTLGHWAHYRIEFIEPMPWSSTMVVDMVVASGNVTVAANGAIAQRLVNILQLNELNLLQLRWQPLDDVQGILWEQAGTGRNVTRGVQARVDLMTASRDPNLATTTFFILGKDRDMQLEVRNPLPVAQALARFVFFGFRYVLTPLDKVAVQGIEGGRVQSTWLPAEGRGL